MNKFQVSIATALLAVCASAMAHEGMHGPGAEYDVDESGAISPDEYKTYLAATKQDAAKAEARFKELDRNQDGKLSSAEFIRGIRQDNRAQ
jgi:hypothetical protein